MRKIEVPERRARLARRHRLAPGDRVSDVVEAARSMVCLHGTDPVTVYLSAWARVEGMTVSDLERALYGDRSLVKYLAMRRTLFVFPRETLGVAYGEGKSWGGQMPVGPRVLTTLSAAGRIVRASNDGAWTTSRPRWATTESWLGEKIAPSPEAEGVARLVELWLRAFGPGTAADIKWWLGATVAAVRRALADLGAVEVGLDGQVGYVLPDDLEATDPPEPWAALLPPLDPTTMGWFERDWYLLGPYKAQLFDTSGNAGPTAWWDGQIVGGWRQSDTGEVVLQMLEDVGAEGLRALEREAARLTEWFEGKRALPRFPSPLWNVATGAGP
jgi:hypothetical protein